MTKKAPSPAGLILQDNVVRLIALSNKSNSTVAKESGVSLRTIKYITLEGRASGVDTVERLAEYFRMPAWMILVRGLQTDQAVNKQLAELVNNFILANQADKNNIVTIAKRAAEVAVQLDARQYKVADSDNKFTHVDDHGDDGVKHVSDTRLPRKTTTKHRKKEAR